MTDYLSQHTRTRGVQVPQSQPIPGREDRMEPNNAGGYTFTLDKWARLDRFLILGTEGGTYYLGERQLTKQNFKSLEECIKEDGLRVFDKASNIYESGRAPKVDTTIFAIAATAALSANGSEARRRALAYVKYLRTGTHLFQWMEYYRSFRGVGKLFRKAVSEWYSARQAENLAYQMAKYQNRNGWTHKDVLALAHWNPEKISPAHKALGKWAKTGETKIEGLPRIVQAMEGLHKAEFSDQAVVDYIKEFGLTREMLPTKALNSKVVWEALLEKMPLHALVRNLGKMTSIGLIGPFGLPERITKSLSDLDYIRKSRMHPLQLIIAASVYARGAGIKGSLTWQANRNVTELLGNAAEMALGNVEPTNKNIVVGVDISGSMTHPVNGVEYLPSWQAAMVLALCYMKVEPNAHVLAFDTQVHQIGLTTSSTIVQAMSNFRGGGGTDCAVPMQVALNQGWSQVDAFVILTDNESWAGQVHAQTLVETYRQKYGRPTRLIVVSLAANNSDIRDPRDPLALQTVGLDNATPQIINQFIKAEL